MMNNINSCVPIITCLLFHVLIRNYVYSSDLPYPGVKVRSLKNMQAGLDSPDIALDEADRYSVSEAESSQGLDVNSQVGDLSDCSVRFNRPEPELSLQPELKCADIEALPQAYLIK